MKRTSWSQGLSVTADGRGVVPLAGSVAVRLLADRVGLTERLSAALTRRGFAPGHDRGQVWVDVATMLTAGGEAIADIDTLAPSRAGCSVRSRRRRRCGGRLDEATPAALARVEKARAQGPAATCGACCRSCRRPTVAGTDLGEMVVLDVDATLVTAHSEKEQAAATFKGGFGFHPLGVWCDNTDRAAGGHVAAGQRRQQPRRGPHRRPDPGDRPGPGRASASGCWSGPTGPAPPTSCWTG